LFGEYDSGLDAIFLNKPSAIYKSPKLMEFISLNPYSMYVIYIIPFFTFSWWFILIVIDCQQRQACLPPSRYAWIFVVFAPLSSSSWPPSFQWGPWLRWQWGNGMSL
jgi:hypothetical protein